MTGKKLYLLRQRAITVMVSDSRKSMLQDRSPWYALFLAIVSNEEMSIADALAIMGTRVREG